MRALVVVGVALCAGCIDFQNLLDTCTQTGRCHEPLVVDSGPMDAGLMCAPSMETNVCFKCTDEKCCGQYQQCADDSRCGDFYKKCLPGCADGGEFSHDQCIISCDAQNGAGHERFAKYFACNEANCLAQCSNPGTTADPCITCQYASCRDERSACMGERECSTLNSCVGLCIRKDGGSRAACEATCGQGKAAAAKTAFTRMLDCQLQYCATSCAL